MEDQIPARALAAGGQERLPKFRQPQFFVKRGGQPNRTPLPGTTQRKLMEFDMDRIIRSRRSRLRSLRRVGQEGDSLEARRLLWLMHHGLNRALPSRAVGIGNLTQIEHVLLHDPRRVQAPVFDDGIVGMEFAVLLPSLCAQKHSNGENNPEIRSGKGVGLHYNDPAKVSFLGNSKISKNVSTTYVEKYLAFLSFFSESAKSG